MSSTVGPDRYMTTFVRNTVLMLFQQ